MTENKAESAMPHSKHGELRSYGRRKGRTLSHAQRRACEDVLPDICVTIEDHQAHIPHSDGYNTWHLEIGFGAGEHLLAQAQAHPDILYIGAEPFINGVAQCLMQIEQQQLRNIRIFPDNVYHLLDALPDHCMAHTDILFPDPWRKKAHHKRRLVNQVTLSKLARVMAPDATLLIATDHAEYGAWILEQVALSPDVMWSARSEADFCSPPAHWVTTRYQAKAAREGREDVLFVRCRRST